MNEEKQSSKVAIGWWIFLGLALVTAIEFWLSSSGAGSLGYLTVTSLVKAALIVHFFMHVSQSWRGKAERE
jgi:hypothetical protein